jgi:hypothetical protein
MNTSTPFDAAESDVEDALLQLEMRIARRADELAATRHGERTDAVESWWQAEREVLAETAGDWRG